MINKARVIIFTSIWTERVRILRLKRCNQTDEHGNIKSVPKTYSMNITSNWDFSLGFAKGKTKI